MLETISPRFRISTAAVAAMFCVCATTAAHGAGLPSQASQAAGAVLARLGITPGPNGHAPQGHVTNSGKGAAVSALAGSTDLAGRAKGAAISALASGAASHA